MMTAYGTVETAWSRAMREGAYDFVEKPAQADDHRQERAQGGEHAAVSSSPRTASLRNEIKLLTRRRDRRVDRQRPLRRVLDVATQAAPSSATVLILGESGTGKELVALASSTSTATAPRRPSWPSTARRSRGPSSRPSSSATSEARSPAPLSRREGRFAQAAGGTLFLDEIGELSPSVQVKLLRVLQEGEYEPVGGDTVRADVRVVAATNKDLRAEVTAGRFREDLFYRLNVIAVTAPPLRARREDIPLLVDHFLGVYCAKNNRPRMEAPRELLAVLSDYSWPGNVRELENVIERAVVLCRAEKLTVEDLPDVVREGEAAEPSTITFSVGTPLDEVERRLIRETLRHAKGDKSVAAQLLGISTRTIYRKLGELE